MVRPSRESVMMDHAKLAALRGTCSRLKVGAVVSRDFRPLSTGYNGNVSGVAHCYHPREELKIWSGEVVVIDADDSETGGCETAMHAEANALAFSARYGVATDGADMFVTHQPCLACARLIVNSGIIAVYFEHPYRKKEGLELLLEVGIEVFCRSALDGSFVQVMK